MLFWNIIEARENPFEGFTKAKDPFFHTSSLLLLSKKTSKKLDLNRSTTIHKTLKIDQNITKPNYKKIVKIEKNFPIQKNLPLNNTDKPLTLEELSKKYILLDCCKAKRVHNNNKHKQKKRKKNARKDKNKRKFNRYKKEIYSNCNFKIYQYGNTIKLLTKDCLKNKMILKNPNRVVFDFYKKIKIKPKKFYLKNSNIKKIAIASHTKFYRITLYTKSSNIHIKKDRASFFIIY